MIKSTITFAFVAALASLVACGGSKDSGSGTDTATSTSTSTAR